MVARQGNNTPRYQCGAHLLGATDAQAAHPDGNSVVFYDSPQDCMPPYPGTRLTYPAVLDYSSLSDRSRRRTCASPNTRAPDEMGQLCPLTAGFTESQPASFGPTEPRMIGTLLMRGMA